MQYYLPEKRLVDRLIGVHVDLPQEEDFALGNEAGYSFYYWFYFPKDHQRITNEFLVLPSEDQLRNKIYREKIHQVYKAMHYTFGWGPICCKKSSERGQDSVSDGFVPRE